MRRILAPLKRFIIGGRRDPVLRALIGQRVRRLPTLRQLRYLPRILAPRERVVFGIAFALVLVSGWYLMYGWYLRTSHEIATTGGEYVEGIVGAPRYLNPVLAVPNSADDDIVRLVYAGLTRYDAQTQTYVPDLAERVERSPDGKVYTVTLRPNLLWHDGESVTSEDVVTTIHSIQDPAIASPYYVSWRGVDVETVDERTVRFRLPEAFASFSAVLSIGLIPTHLWSDITPAQFALAEANIKPVGVGPYRATEMSRDRKGNILSYVFVAARDRGLAGPYLNRITFKFYSEVNEAMDAFTSGSIDGLGYVPPERLEDIRGNQTVYHVALRQITGVFFHWDDADVLADRNVRAALDAVVPKDKLMADVFGEGARLPKHFLLSSDQGTCAVGCGDVDAARRLLNKAGWTLLDRAAVADRIARGKVPTLKTASETYPDQSAFWVKNGAPLVVRMATAEDPTLQKAGEYVRDAWRRLGIVVTLETYPAKRLASEVITPRNYQALLYSIRYGVGEDPYPFWHSSQQRTPGLALTSLHDRRVDTLLEELRGVVDSDVRVARRDEIAQRIQHEAVGIPLAQALYLWVMPTKIQGVAVTGLSAPADRLSGIADWYLKTRRSFFK